MFFFFIFCFLDQIYFYYFFHFHSVFNFFFFFEVMVQNAWNCNLKKKGVLLVAPFFYLGVDFNIFITLMPIIKVATANKS